MLVSLVPPMSMFQGLGLVVVWSDMIRQFVPARLRPDVTNFLLAIMGTPLLFQVHHLPIITLQEGS